MRWITLLLACINAMFADRSRLALESVALRHQLAVLRRNVKRPKVRDGDEARTHLSLDRNAPLAGVVEGGAGEVVAIPHLGGLHHRYARVA